MSDSNWANITKQGVSANLWSAVVRPFLLALPWQYVNPTAISWTNITKN